jgi:hypothetical protein
MYVWCFKGGGLQQGAQQQGIALILGSLIAWGLGHISEGALYVYQYIFLGEYDQLQRLECEEYG